MFPPHESDVAQLPYPPTDAGGANSGAPSPSNPAADEGTRWQVIGPLPHALAVPPPIADPAAADPNRVVEADAASADSRLVPPPAVVSDASSAIPAPSASFVAVVPPPPAIAVPAASVAVEGAAVEDAATEKSVGSALGNGMRGASTPSASPPTSASPQTLAAPSPAENVAPPEVSPDLIEPARLGDVPCWLVSIIVHLAVLVALALIPGWWGEKEKGLATALRFEDRSLDALVENEEPQIDEVDLTSLDMAESQIIEAAEIDDVLDGIGLEDDLLAAESDAFMPPSEADAMLAATSDQLLNVATGSDLSGRGTAGRGALVRSGGGTAASEEAVALALKWIVAHQAKDGGWNFDHRQGTTCGKRCGNSGNARSARNGATAMALLPLLGAGNTHKSGRYQENVDRGLRFLALRQDAKTGSFHEPQGDMYSHGLAAIAMCEAYAMTKDRKLHQHAQGSLKFIVTAQDPVGGGWRYAPRQAGDTSVVGWQMMALKSGLMGYLDVPPNTIKLAERFLDHVQDGDGSRYGSSNSGGEPATTSIGLLCRMYMGWRREHPALVRGVEYLGKTGPSDRNMYYNYYATQVVHHYGGETWKQWNAKMRDSLVKSQEKTGHASGSWHMRDRFVGQGGRLYCTAMAAMILEVYYRHLPIYRQESIEERFRASE